MSPRLAIRWTIGDVSPRGFTALRLSAWGAYRIFGDQALYRVVVNSVSPDEVARRAAPLPPGLELEPARELPAFLGRELDAGLAEGVAGKFAPLRLFPDLHELSLDNDCVLWSEPEPLRRWRGEPASFLLAEDVIPAMGRFGGMLGRVARNSGVRGLPPRCDLGAALLATRAAAPGPLRSELDEQGLQTLALVRAGPVHVVGLEDLTVCSPFPPHLPGLRRCGAHFVGLNARRLGFEVDGRGAEELTREHFDRLLPEVRARLGLGEALAPRRPRERSAPGEETWR